MYVKVPAEIVISENWQTKKSEISIMIDGPIGQPERDLLGILRTSRDPWVFLTERPWMYDPTNPGYELAQRLRNGSQEDSDSQD